MQIGDQEFLLPTMMLGGYPKPRWYSGQGFATVPLGSFIPDSISFEAFEDCMGALVHDQETSGLDVISDARVLGGDSPFANAFSYFSDRISGFAEGAQAQSLPGGQFWLSPMVVTPIARKVPMLLKQLEAVKKFTGKPVKVSYPGLTTLVAGSTNQYYDEVRQLALDLAKVYNQEFRRMADAGADIIQLDEFAWYYGTPLAEWEADAFRTAVDGVRARIMVHVCRGTQLAAADRTQEERATVDAARLRAIACPGDLISYEVAQPDDAGLLPLGQENADHDIVAGVIDVRTVEVETPAQVAHRIRRHLATVAADRLAVGTDCGLVNLPRMVAQAKLHALVEGARTVRNELAHAQSLGTGPSSSLSKTVG